MRGYITAVPIPIPQCLLCCSDKCRFLLNLLEFPRSHDSHLSPANWKLYFELSMIRSKKNYRLPTTTRTGWGPLEGFFHSFRHPAIAMELPFWESPLTPQKSSLYKKLHRTTS
jgi:hypothetical protein